MNGLDNLLGIAFSASHLRSARNTANQAYQNALANALAAHQPSNVAPIREPRKAGKVCDVCRYDHSAVIGADGFCAQLRADLSWRKVARPSQNRTPEEIQAQLEARYAEMEAEAERLRAQALTACSACRWGKGSFCKQPLVIGIEQEPTVNVDRHPEGRRNSICGPEKALWEPIPTRWQRFMEWLAKVIERMEGVRG